MMDEQVAFSGFDEADAAEAAVYQEILPQLQAAAAEVGADATLISRERNKDYSTISFGGTLSFRLRLRKQTHYIEVPLSAKDIVAPLAPPDRQRKAHGEKASGAEYWRVSLRREDVLAHADVLGRVIQYTIEHLPKEWDCCSRYMECSDAKQCVHPDKSFALGCGYRKILASGRIFYGMNRNID
jgi:hypothetical protein